MTRYEFVAAIDLGTMYSGVAFQPTGLYNPDHPIINIFSSQIWNHGQINLVSLKTPTSLLLDRNQDIDSFGFVAEEKYIDLCLDGDENNWYFFRRFKMQLHDTNELKKSTTIADESGRDLPALTVFSKSIECLKDNLITILEESNAFDRIEMDVIKWVLTVPAIWNDAAKRFMREAAEMAKIPSQHLTIALEPEAASLFCQYLPVEKFKSCGHVDFSDAKSGTTYMVVDLGGGTADITVHEKIANGKLKEVYPASGGPWGGTSVDGAFIALISNIVGGPVMASFMKEQKYDYLDLMREFESAKRHVSMSTTDDVRMKIPIELGLTCMKVRKKDFKTLVKEARQDKNITFISDKARFKPTLMQDLFRKVTNKILTHMKMILDTTHAGQKVSLILMVGGFSESAFVQDVITNEFNEKNGRKVIVPFEPDISVLQGAVVYGRQPGNIAALILRYSYGVAVSQKFEEGMHDQKKMATIAGVRRCKDVFSKLLTIGTEVEIGHLIKKKYNTNDPSTTTCTILLFVSTDTNPKYTDDDSCKPFGRLELQFDNPENQILGFDVEYVFGDTELRIVAMETKSKQACQTTLKMLE